MNPKRINFQKKTGRFLVIAGAVMAGMPQVAQRSMIDPTAKIILSVVGLCLVSLGGYLHYRARQYTSQALANKIIDEGGPYVLYLRPFKTDSTVSASQKATYYATALSNLQSTMEEDLFKVLEPFGNLIAIGKPGEKLPAPGAVRIYAAEDWKEVVTDKMKGARLVIIHAGVGVGLNWELKQAFEILDAKKLLIFMPEMSKDIYEFFRKTALEKLGIALPERSELKVPRSKYGHSGFIRFSKEKVPEFLPLYAPMLRVNPHSPYQARFTCTLKPVFEDFGLEWHLPPVLRGNRIAMVFLIVMVLLILLVVVLAMLGKT